MWDRREKWAKGWLFFLFLNFIQINAIFADNLRILSVSLRFLCCLAAFCSTCWSRGTSEHSMAKAACLPLRLWVGTFPRFVAVGFWFLSETLVWIASPIIVLFICSHLALNYSAILPWTLSFRHLNFIFEHLSRDFEKTTITAMYHGRWFASMILPCPNERGEENVTHALSEARG